MLSAHTTNVVRVCLNYLVVTNHGKPHYEVFCEDEEGVHYARLSGPLRDAVSPELLRLRGAPFLGAPLFPVEVDLDFAPPVLIHLSL
jgi:hypothetical protein